MIVLLSAILVRAEESELIDSGGEPVPEDSGSPGEREKDVLEQKQEELSAKIVSTATWMDGFFDDELYRTTSNKTYIRFNLSPTFDDRGFHFNTYTDIRLQLPNSERWLINMGGAPDEEDPHDRSSLEDAEDATSGSDDKNAYVGISTFLKRTRTRNVGTGGGFKLRSDGLSLYGSLKWIELWEFDSWDLRATQRFRVYTYEKPDFKTTLDVDWPIAHKFLLRTSGSALFQVDNPIEYYDADFSLFHFLTTRRALQYKIRTGFVSSPQRPCYLDRVIAEVEYRHQWRRWFSTSLVPFVKSQDSKDWKSEPGVRLDFSVRFGYVGDYEFKSAFTQKQEANKIRTQEERDKSLRESHERLQQWQRDSEDVKEQ